MCGDVLRGEIWGRDEGTCQHCGKLLYQVVVADQRKEALESALQSLVPELPMYRWEKDCWKCKRRTPIVTYHVEADYDYSIWDQPKLDRILMERYPFVRPQFSHTLGARVVANSCVNCGAFQGNLQVAEDILELLTDEAGMQGMVDTWVANRLTLNDLAVTREELPGPTEVTLKIPLLGHIHHKDRNPENNDLQNLVLLCRGCHRSVHRAPQPT